MNDTGEPGAISSGTRAPARPLRVLLVEDCDDDAVMILRALRAGGFDPTWERVDTAEALHAALARRPWDIVLADYTMPPFGGPAALRLVQESGLDLPFIVVSGTIGEEVAVATMQAGAHDYVLKSNLNRLVPAVARALREAEMWRERWRVEEALRQSEERFALAVAGANDGLWDINFEAQEVYFFPRCMSIMGFTDSEFQNRPEDWHERVHPDDFNRAAAALAAHMEGVTDHYESEHRLRHKDGTYRWVLARGLLLRDAEGKPYRMAGSLTDITERKQAEEGLRDSAERFRLLTEHAYDLIVELNIEGRFLYASPSCTEALGYEPSEIVGTCGFELSHPDDLPGVLAVFGRERGQVVARVRHKSGEWRWIEATGKGFWTATGERRGVITARDITERKRAEEALAYQANLLANVNDAVVATDTAMTLTAWNRAAEAMYGWAAEDVLGRCSRDVLRTEFIGTDSPTAMRTLVETGRWSGELTQRRRDGTRISVEAKIIALRDEAGKIIGGVSVNRDITERTRAEEALRESEERYRRLVELSPDGIAIHSDGTFLFVNPAAARLVGAGTPDELIGKSILDLVHPDSRDLARARLTQIAQGTVQPTSVEEKLLRLDGGAVDAEVTTVPFSYHGKPAAHSIVRDVTQRKRAEQLRAELEEELRQAQRLDAIARLAGGVAHDFNNQLTVIKGCAQFLLAGLAADDPRRGDAERISATVNRSAQLVRQLLAFSREEPIELQAVDLGQLVHEMEPMLRPLLGEPIALRVATAPTAWPVHADPMQIQRVIMNLVTNAKDAMAAGGTLTLETANVAIEAGAGRDGGEHLTPGRYVVLTVSDTGCGIPPAVRERIFEPFFTTKGLGKGTGLGLSTAYGIVKQHGGHIACESQPGRGTTFRVYLPRDDRERGALPRSRPDGPHQAVTSDAPPIGPEHAPSVHRGHQ